MTFFEPSTTDAHGQIFLTGIVDIAEYRQVDLEMIQFPGDVPNLTVNVNMGKLSGSTLAQTVGTFLLGTDAVIHTFSVVGPEMTVVIVGGPPSTVIDVQAWVFLH
ncbi:MAG TPA: hypothetical protein VHF27_00075 [Acidimicrobiales bacterium]|nr:hypothetical protein [Acidimicrobiales bacterium]